MRVYFIGAGPGAADLITVRGARILAEVSVILYAGSLVPEALLTYCRKDANIINTASLDLDAQVSVYIDAQERDVEVARLHSGDPSIYGATSEQMRRLRELGIEYEVVPGVPSFAAAAASCATELTKPGVSQTIILTRISGRASSVPESEALTSLAQHRSSMCIFLSGPHLATIVEQLASSYPPTTPIALVHRATWSDEKKHVSTLGKILDEVNPSQWALTTMVLVGDVLDEESGSDSRLYSAQYSHKFRRASANV